MDSSCGQEKKRRRSIDFSSAFGREAGANRGLFKRPSARERSRARPSERYVDRPRSSTNVVLRRSLFQHVFDEIDLGQQTNDVDAAAGAVDDDGDLAARKMHASSLRNLLKYRLLLSGMMIKTL